MPEKVWAVTMVGDEVDIVEYSLQHMVSEGVDGIIIADNLSTDGTRQLIEKVKASVGIPIIIMEDKEIGYYQDRKMNFLARLAHEQGASWIIPFDIDELWCGLKKPLAEVLRREPRSQVIGLHSFTRVETGYDVISENPFLRLVYRFSYSSRYCKVCYKFSPDIVIGMGNDAVYDASSREKKYEVFDDALAIQHFPWRSVRQFINKMKRGAAAYAATNLPENYGRHWRVFGRILEQEGEAAVFAIYYAQYFVAEPYRLSLVEDKAPWCRWK